MFKKHKVTSLWEGDYFDHFEDVNTLLQMSSKGGEVRVHSAKDLMEHIRCPTTVTFGAWDFETKEKIVSISTLHWFEVAERWHAVLYDVVTHNDYHRHGYGDAVMKSVLDHIGMIASTKNKEVDVKLTSGPDRKSAHTFYEKHGFVMRSSGCGDNPTCLFEKIIPPN